MLLDMAKGFAPVFLAQWLFPGAHAIGILAATAAVAGHIWTPFLGFRGGKGVATAAGAFLGLAPLLLAIGLGVFIVVTAVGRYVSLGSVVAALTAFAASFALPLLGGRPVDWLFAAFCGASAAGIIFAHRRNIARLFAGTESKLGSPSGKGRGRG